MELEEKKENHSADTLPDLKEEPIAIIGVFEKEDIIDSRSQEQKKENQSADTLPSLKEEPVTINEVFEKEDIINSRSQQKQENQSSGTLPNLKDDLTTINKEIFDKDLNNTPQVFENNDNLTKVNTEEPAAIILDDVYEIEQEDSNDTHQASILDQVFEIEQEDSNDSPRVSEKDSKLKKEELAAIANEVFEKEKEDIIDPRWQQVKNLSSNQERYNQVKACWQSATVPDPNKNLTFHSYRKRHFKKFQPIRQHKRQASTKLSGGDAKRSRPCTFIFDDKINSIYKEKEKEDQKIMNEMQRKINNIEKEHYRKKISLETNITNKGFHNFHNSFRDELLVNLKQAHHRQVACIKDEYLKKASKCVQKYQSGLTSLNNVRDEILQFYSFYKGLGESSEKDPTILSDSQFQELKDIDNFYSQMHNYYN